MQLYLLKKRLWNRCFPVNFVKFLRTPFRTEHLPSGFFCCLSDLQLGFIITGVTVNNYSPKKITPGVIITREKSTPGVIFSWEKFTPTWKKVLP